MFEIVQGFCGPSSTQTHLLTWASKRPKDHFCPQPTETACCHIFYKHYQNPRETVTARWPNTAISPTLRDCCFCGLRDKKLQWQLLAKKTLDFKTALEEALAVEVADQSLREVWQSWRLVNNKKNPRQSTERVLARTLRRTRKSC